MEILFLSHYYPPETNAPANRVSELAGQWTRDGHRVSVVTCAPNHPQGVIYPGYRNRLFTQETVDGVRVIRLWTWLAANEGVLLRTINYLSYLAAVALALPRLPRADVVISTSPQFFCGLAGGLVAFAKRRPWVLEVRDLWPESIVEVGALKKGLAVGLLERIEAWAYRTASEIVSVSPAFTPHLRARGGRADRITIIENGVDLSLFKAAPADEFRRQHGLEGKFVAAYVGTHGMAHHLETVLEAAALTRQDEQIAYLLVGSGAERGRLEQMKVELGLSNVIMLDPLPRSAMPTVWSATDASLVLLRKSPLFLSVIPSKIFEAMAMAKPILLGVDGQAREIVEGARCGLFLEPENARQLAGAIRRLANDPSLTRSLGESGRETARAKYDRAVLARRYADRLQAVSDRRRQPMMARASAP